MFIKTSNPAFKDFGDIVYDDIDFSSSHKINLNNKFIDNLKLVTNDYTFIKVTKGVVMILVSFDSNNIKSFINDITDNYQYDIDITIDNNNYKYYGSKLGHNMDITRVVDNKEDYFYQMNDKYYILDTKGNYILTNDSDIFPYIEYRYLDINNIKEYIKLATYNDNIYSIKVSDIVLNSNSSDVITIKVDEDNKNIIIDYTNLFKIDNNNLTKEVVSIKYSNINKINSLEK